MAYLPYYQNYQYPQGYQPQYPQQTVQMTTGVLWVTSEAEAQSYPVAPNNAVALWDSTKPVVYLKQADASGKPLMKVYTLAERDAAGAEQKERTVEYALKSDVDTIQAALTAMKKDIKAIKREIEKEDKNDDE